MLFNGLVHVLLAFSFNNLVCLDHIASKDSNNKGKSKRFDGLFLWLVRNFSLLYV